MWISWYSKNNRQTTTFFNQCNNQHKLDPTSLVSAFLMQFYFSVHMNLPVVSVVIVIRTWNHTKFLSFLCVSKESLMFADYG